MKIAVRGFREADAADVSALIVKTLRTTNIKDYSPEYIEKDVQQFTPELVIQRAGWTHFYVFCDGEKIVGCGAIGPYWGKEDESSLFNIFVLPEYHGKGIGRKIIETLEADEYALRAKRIEIPASITACAFYRKMGYNYKNDIDTPDHEQLYRLEKVRKEIWDAYLPDGSHAGCDLIRGEPIPKGLHHLVCEILVRHTDGDYLLMQRDHRKPNYGGFYEATAGGSALKGEDALTCARRELREETGIESGALTQIGQFISHDTIYFSFLCVTDSEKGAVRLQEGETVSFKWVSEPEFIEFVNSDAVIDIQLLRYQPYLRKMGYLK